MAVFISEIDSSRPDSNLEILLFDFLAQDVFLTLKRLRRGFRSTTDSDCKRRCHSLHSPANGTGASN